MKRALLGPVGSLCIALSLVSLVGCGDAPEVKAPTPPPAPTVEAPPPVVEKPADPPKPEPTAEEKKKAEQLEALAKDRAKMESDNKAELGRWTPELRAEAKALADKVYPTGKAAIQAVLASKIRKAGDAERDKHRHPVETLDFFGLKPTMTVLEFGPGEGWYTELLAPSLAKKGKLFVTNGDPNGPLEERSTFYAQRFKLFLDTSPEAYGKAETVTVDNKAPKLAMEGTLDMVILAREQHGMVQQNKLGDWLAEFQKALKPNGVLAIEQHRAKPDAVPEESAKKGYLPEKWVIEKIEAAGFKLAGKSEINANAKDTKDYADGVWTLPPNFRLGDKDREKYAAIGESDRMTLKFVKVAKAAPKTDKPAATAKPATPATPAKPATPATPAKKP
jgi:predicted methyltransferase